MQKLKHKPHYSTLKISDEAKYKAKQIEFIKIFLLLLSLITLLDLIHTFNLLLVI